MDLEDAVAVAPKIDPAAWAGGFNDMFALVAGEFAQAPSRRRARSYLLGLLSQNGAEERLVLADFTGTRPRRDAAAAEFLCLVC